MKNHAQNMDLFWKIEIEHNQQSKVLYSLFLLHGKLRAIKIY